VNTTASGVPIVRVPAGKGHRTKAAKRRAEDRARKQTRALAADASPLNGGRQP
jgi:hypothetical protein